MLIYKHFIINLHTKFHIPSSNGPLSVPSWKINAYFRTTAMLLFHNLQIKKKRFRDWFYYKEVKHILGILLTASADFESLAGSCFLPFVRQTPLCTNMFYYVAL